MDPEKQVVNSIFDTVKCNFNKSDSIPVVELSRNPLPTKAIEEVFVVCRERHISVYEYNPIVNHDSPLIPAENINRDLLKINTDFYESVYLNLPHAVGIHYEAFQNFYSLGYVEGAAMSLRVLIELFVRDNYGNFIWEVAQGKSTLHIEGDKDYIEQLVDNLWSPKLSQLLGLLSGDNSSSEPWLETVRKKYRATRQNKIWVSPASFGKLKASHKKASGVVHGADNITDMSKLRSQMIEVLNVIKEYFDKKNGWGVEYDK